MAKAWPFMKLGQVDPTVHVSYLHHGQLPQSTQGGSRTCGKQAGGWKSPAAGGGGKRRRGRDTREVLAASAFEDAKAAILRCWPRLPETIRQTGRDRSEGPELLTPLYRAGGSGVLYCSLFMCIPRFAKMGPGSDATRESSCGRLRQAAAALKHKTIEQDRHY